MKLVLILLFILCNYANGVKPPQKLSLTVDPIKYADDKNFLQAGLAKKIVCTGSAQNQKLDWYDPSGKVVRRQSGGRIQVQDQVVLSFKAKSRSKVLSIAHAMVPDSGVWECRSGALRANVSLCVIDPVEFMDPIHEINVDAGRSVSLSCKAKGDPEPTILWERNGETIADDGTTSKYKVMTKYFSEGIEGLITITSLDNTDSGNYSCVAYQENSLVEDCWERDILNISLNVRHAPFFVPDNETIIHILNTDESVDLVCSATANPEPTYKWFYENGVNQSKYPEQIIKKLNGTQSILTVKPNLSNHEERYLCKASNAYGSATMTYRVIELEEPHKPTELEIANVTHNSITIIWDDDEIAFPVDSVDVQYYIKRSNLPPRQLQWKRAKAIQIIKYDEEEPQIAIEDLDEDTEYWIRLRLVNAAGSSDWTEPLLASTDILVEPEENIIQDIKEGTSVEKKAHVDPIFIQSQRQLDQQFEPAFIGIFCLAAVVIIGVACMLVVKKLNNKAD